MLTKDEIKNTIEALKELGGSIALECTAQDDAVDHPIVVLIENDESFYTKLEKLMSALDDDLTEVHGKVIVNEIDSDESLELRLVVDSSAFYVMSHRDWESRPVYYHAIRDLNSQAEDSIFGESIATNDGRTIHAFDTADVVRDILEEQGFLDFDGDDNSPGM